MIKPSELDLQPGKKKEVNIICYIPQGEEERYYARMVLEVDSSEKEENGVDIKQETTEELLAVSQKFKEISSNDDKPLKFMITFKKSGKTKLNSNKKTAGEVQQVMVKKINLERQVEFLFPEGIRGLKGTYNKRLPQGKYIAEISFGQGEKVLIFQSYTFSVQ